MAIPPRIRFLRKSQNNNSGVQKEINKENKESDDLNVCNDSETNRYSTSNESDDEDDNAMKRISHTQKHDNTSFMDGRCEHENNENVHNFIKIVLIILYYADDSDDDLLTVKRRNIDIDDMSDTIENIKDDKSNKKKIITKVAVAKKILKKKIIPNSKKTFGDDGMVIFYHIICEYITIFFFFFLIIYYLFYLFQLTNLGSDRSNEKQSVRISQEI